MFEGLKGKLAGVKSRLGGVISENAEETETPVEVTAPIEAPVEVSPPVSPAETTPESSPHLFFRRCGARRPRAGAGKASLVGDLPATEGR